MAFANLSDIISTTIESRTKACADNVTKNNALLARLEQRGKVKPFSGGSKILQEISFAENANGGYYSGYDILPVGVSDVISAAEFQIKQAAVPVVISGLEMLQRLRQRHLPAECRIRRSSADITAIDATTVQAAMNNMWAQLVRGTDRPDLIMVDNTFWSAYMASLQAIQRFTSEDSAALGFPSVKFMDADVVLDGGIGGYADAGTCYMLNTDYLHYRPHSKRNMVSLSPNKRYATNQDAEVNILAWAGNLTSSGCQFQGRITAS